MSVCYCVSGGWLTSICGDYFSLNQSGGLTDTMIHRAASLQTWILDTGRGFLWLRVNSSPFITKAFKLKQNIEIRSSPSYFLLPVDSRRIQFQDCNTCICCWRITYDSKWSRANNAISFLLNLACWLRQWILIYSYSRMCHVHTVCTSAACTH